MTIEELKVELSLLTVSRERLEREILGIANYGCLAVEEARRKIDEMEKAGKKTVVFCGIKCLSVRDRDGNEQPLIPSWYPLYAAIDDFFNPPIDEPLFEAIKGARWQNLRRWLCTQGNENENGYARARAAIDTVNKDLEQYRQNGRDIEDLERLLNKMETEGHKAENKQVRGNENKALNHYFMRFCEQNYPDTYKAMRSGLEKGCILFDGEKFNFLLPVGKVCHLFSKTGCTEAKEITKYILIDGKEASVNSLRNAQNYKLEEWTELKTLLEL